MRAATVIAPLTAVTVLTALAPLGAVPAHAATSGDWRSQACASSGSDVRAGDTYTVVTKDAGRLERVPTLTVTIERLVFDGGVQCDLLQLDGRLPFGTELRGHGAEVDVMGELVINGVDQGEMQLSGSFHGVGGSAPIRVVRHVVLNAVTYVPDESGTVPDSPTLPEPWRNQPYTSTHTRTTFSAHVSGRIGTEKPFTVTHATRAAAERRLAAELEVAQHAVDRRAARRTYRLALRGIRLVMTPFRERWSGELAR